MNSRLGGLGALLLAVVVLVGGCSDGGGGTSGPTTTRVQAGQAGIGTPPCEADQRSDPGEEHVPDPTYTVDPPAGGEHLPAAAPPGAYRQPPPDGNVVHAMEHGYVVVWFRPDVEDAVQAALVELGRRFEEELLIVPRPSLQVPIALTAWHQRLLCTAADVEQMAAFVTAYRDQGPETGFL